MFQARAGALPEKAAAALPQLAKASVALLEAVVQHLSSLPGRSQFAPGLRNLHRIVQASHLPLRSSAL